MVGRWRCTFPSIHLFRLKIAVGCLTSTYPSIRCVVCCVVCLWCVVVVLCGGAWYGVVWCGVAVLCVCLFSLFSLNSLLSLFSLSFLSLLFSSLSPLFSSRHQTL